VCDRERVAYLPDEHVVHDGPEAPPVHGKAVPLVCKSLWSHVLDGAAKGARLAVRLSHRDLAQPKVGQENVAWVPCPVHTERERERRERARYV
jgi:hypothetical protein